ncbi:MAG: formylglycine-generating enzyme family protein [Akkermansiaceae bacterium]
MIERLIVLALVVSSVSAAEPTPAGMAWIPDGTFTMGSSQPGSRPDEKPEIPVSIDGFWIDTAPVTNAQFRKFAAATGYQTTAEQPVNWEELKRQLPPGTPRPPAEALLPGSLVFTPPTGKQPVNLGAMEQWWTWTHGASWRNPDGPGSDLKGREDHPVVHVSWDDATAYAKWAGKRLPTEAEWEYAARGGLEGKRFAWGDDFKPGGKFMTNTWTGKFPSHNSAEDGFPATSPVRSFPANGYGLFDMGGNVWNWCMDWYRPDTLARNKLANACHNPSGPPESYSPGRPHQKERVTKGGSFLCHVDYCESYRPSARRGTAQDTGMSHIGFRCALSGPAPISP